MADPLVSVTGLSKHYPVQAGLIARLAGQRRPPLVAVDEVSFEIARGEIFSLVGESGSGKTTLGRCLLRLIEPTAGRILFDGTDLAALPPGSLRAARRDVQMIFQDPFSSLNPRMTVGEMLAEVLRVHRLRPEPEIAGRVAELLGLVGLPAEAAGRAPRAFSGGQRQRIGIARALAVEPRFIVADEPVSAVDVSVQAQIMNLLLELRDRLGLTLLFIAHDLSVVRYLSDRVGVMYLGRIVESGPRDLIFGGTCGRTAIAARSAAGLPFPYALPARNCALPHRGPPARDRGGGTCRPLSSSRHPMTGEPDGS
jgi:ABC-type oligopeptide transport system ATPase subunit